MLSTHRPVPASSRPAVGRPWTIAGASALALTLLSLLALSPAQAAKAQTATVSLTRVAVDGTTITVSGRVRLPIDTAKERKHAQVYLTLTGDTGTATKTESFTTKLTGKDAFTVKHTTTLSGALGLDVVVKIGGRQSGRRIVRTITVTTSGSVTGGTGTATGPSAGASTPGSGSSTPGSPSNPGSPSTPGTQLNGTFEVEQGVEHPDGLLSGTYFRMQGVGNDPSPFGDKEYTPLSPGTEGGLETFAYQEPPVPAFADGDVGGALANEIVQPQDFFEVNFSIVTAPTDPQEGLPDPLPQIFDTNGKLSGQITAWNAQWNGSSFNQGAPKASGTLPTDEKGSTTLPTGTYDAATGHYVLTWTSVIVGGAFGGFIGEWHLEGTFVAET
jgi:hypothetical protein